MGASVVTGESSVELLVIMNRYRVYIYRLLIPTLKAWLAYLSWCWSLEGELTIVITTFNFKRFFVVSS